MNFKNNKNRVIIIFFVFSISILIYYIREKGDSKYWYEDNLLVAHALGGIDGKTYTNSKESIEFNYKNFHRIFEVDLSITKDGQLVCRHGWEADLAKLYEQRIPNDLIGKSLDLSTFKDYKIYRKYTPITFKELLEYMKKHKDIYIITDSKLIDNNEIKTQFIELVKEVKDVDQKLLNRIIPQVYNEEMFYTIRNIYNFKDIIYTLYLTDSSNEKVLDFALLNNIKVITMSSQRYSKEFVEMLSSNGIYSYIHTINSLSEIEKYKKEGVHGFYTDFIIPSDFRHINVQ
jgi:glycerophosphoryl diester phosphodiesterase